MAPTEVLAKQHYETVEAMFRNYDVPFRAVLVTGSMTAKEKRLAYEKIASHEADIIIGTHALIQEKVVYDRLALVITDEQHRFGVAQRELLGSKGSFPHMIVMSATPIPRTLAIILYGDLDISVIDQVPANRLPIKNCVVDTSYRSRAYKFIAGEVEKGRQAYVICPMVEESEMIQAENVLDYTKVLRENLPGIRVEYLHGRMKGKEKNGIMEAFARGEIQVLVSTTVVEVGVDVPNATVMLIENGERFGLATLHQLRGRVGRGKLSGSCYVMCALKRKRGRRSPAIDRLEALESTTDGFALAEMDLRLRHEGEILGLRQHGGVSLRFVDLDDDADLIEWAHADAIETLRYAPSLDSVATLPIRHRVIDRYGDIFKEVSGG